MTAEQHRELVRQFYARVWGAGEVEFAREVFADDYVRHDLRPTTGGPGWQGQAAIASAFRTAFPDLAFHVDLVIGDGEFVAARWTAEGTFTGPWGGREPNGRRARFSGVNIFRLRDGKVVENGTTATTSGCRSSSAWRCTRAARRHRPEPHSSQVTGRRWSGT